MNIGVLLALASAAVWGSGDFCGGRAAARQDSFQVLAMSALSGVAMLIAVSMATGEPFRTDASVLWAAAAGVGSAVGIVALYTGLSLGDAATVAPLAGVIAAVLPVVFSALTQGLPGRLQVAGFAFALAGIWLVAHSATTGGKGTAGVRLGVLAGAGFGTFLILIAQVPHDAVFVPLAIARAMMVVAGLGVLLVRRTPVPRVTSSGIAIVAGVLDAGGTVLYLMAQQRVRLDIAAVLSSLYPVATVLLARTILHEPISRMQWVGAAVCLMAVALIAA
jgi:drug/metabolite transporter (DMT)-like permease